MLFPCSPLLPETERLIGRDALERVKPSAILINTARGGFVDEAALVGLYWAAVCAPPADVFEEEPLRAGSPLWRSTISC
jgi:phosphoglycerate dehydrogenase-like enzyme